jgi:hypothetical protein
MKVILGDYSDIPVNLAEPTLLPIDGEQSMTGAPYFRRVKTATAT